MSNALFKNTESPEEETQQSEALTTEEILDTEIDPIGDDPSEVTGEDTVAPKADTPAPKKKIKRQPSEETKLRMELKDKIKLRNQATAGLDLLNKQREVVMKQLDDIDAKIAAAEEVDTSVLDAEINQLKADLLDAIEAAV